MMSRLSTFILGLLVFASCASVEPQEYDRKTGVVYIDGERWMFVSGPTHCSNYIDTAALEYAESPVYDKRRPLDLEHSRFLANSEGECWVEIQVVGASTFSFLFRVSEDMEVVDKRMFSKYAPHINPYPTTSYEP